jgi:hypothetical protein
MGRLEDHSRCFTTESIVGVTVVRAAIIQRISANPKEIDPVFDNDCLANNQ